jgi:hypothetical protein
VRLDDRVAGGRAGALRLAMGGRVIQMPLRTAAYFNRFSIQIILSGT